MSIGHTKNKDSKTKKLIIAISCTIIILVAILVIYLFSNSTTKSISNIENEYNNSDSTELNEVDNSSIEQNNINLSLDGLKAIWDTFTGRMTVYALCYYNSSDYNVVIRNIYGEALTEDVNAEGFGIYKNDGTYLYITSENLVYGYNLNALSFVDYAISAVESGIATMHAYELYETGEYDERGIYNFAIDLNGIDKIGEFYGQLDETFGDQMAESLRNSLETDEIKNIASNLNEEANDLSYRLNIICDSNNILEVSLVAYFGNETLGYDTSVHDKEYTIWYFNKYYLIPDWKLDDEWYTFDFWTNVSSDDGDKQTIIDMCDKAVTEISGIVNNYFDQLNEIIDSANGNSSE